MSDSRATSVAMTDDQLRRLDEIKAELEPILETDSNHEAISLLSQWLDKEDLPSPLRAELFVRRAELRVDVEDNEAAVEDIRQSLELGATGPTLQGVAGWAFFNMEKFEAARRHFEQALADAPDEIELLIGHALVLQELDELEHARADLSHAIHVEPSNAELYAMRSEVHLRMRDVEAAERDIRTAREFDPDDPDYALALTRLLMVSGRLEEALEVADDAVGSGSDFSLESILLRSHLRLLSGMSKEARDDAMRASNRYSDEAFAFVQLAHVQLAEGNVGLSTKAAERAVKLDSSLPDSYMVHGAALQMSGRADEAREDFQRASQAPAELPMFLLGPAYDLLDAGGLNMNIMDLLQDQTEGGFDPSKLEEAFQGFGGIPGMGGAMPGMGGMDPMQMLGQIFDDSGSIRGPLKPFFEMAFKNAPKIMQNMPPGLMSGLGGFDPGQLDDMDLSNLSSEQIEEQMREFYKAMQSGESPFGAPKDEGDDGSDGDEE
ncbi:MAG: tetratricopeptide repeat protein [Bradymonadaceae bacterium]